MQRQHDARLALGPDGAEEALAALQFDLVVQFCHDYSFVTSKLISTAAVCGEETSSTALPARPIVRT